MIDQEGARTDGPRGGLWFYVVVAAGIFAALSAPGQTQGLSPFTDPLINELNLDRTSLSISYLIATLVGASTMPAFGRALDRFGAKNIIFFIGLALVLVLLATSFVSDIFGLTAGYIGLRMFGQGALILASTTLVARTVRYRPGLALGLSGAIGSAGISIAPVGVERLISLSDLSTTWRIEAVVVAVVIFPLILFLPKDQKSNSEVNESDEALDSKLSHSASYAYRTAMFWVFAGAGFVAGMMATGLSFHLISILGAQGLTSLEAASNFVPQTFAYILATLALGAIVDKTDPRLGVVISMLALAGAMLMLPYVHPGTSAIFFGVLLGLSQGALKGVEAAGFLRYFGRANIGQIRGVATGISLASSSLGPLYFAIGLQAGGSYLQVSAWGSLLPLAIVLLSLVAKKPRPLGDLSEMG